MKRQAFDDGLTLGEFRRLTVDFPDDMQLWMMATVARSKPITRIESATNILFDVRRLWEENDGR